MTGYFGGYSQYSNDFEQRESEVARAIARASADTTKPLVSQTMYPDTAPSAALRAGGAPVYGTIESAARSLAALLPAGVPKGAPAMPAPESADLDAGYFGSRDLLAAAGVPFAAAERAPDRDGVLAAADGIGYPVVLKAL